MSNAVLPAVLGRLLHSDPPVGALTDANHHAAMVFVEGTALESAGRLRAMLDDGRIVAERPDDDLDARAPGQPIARRTIVTDFAHREGSVRVLLPFEGEDDGDAATRHRT